MQNFIEALAKNINHGNWYSVLFTCLTLPDICGKIDEPNSSSSARSINWFNKYMKPKYTLKIGSNREEHVFLHGEDFYALRCAYLHEGSDIITSQRARKALDNFKFVTTTHGNIVHKNKFGNTLQLQVDVFGDEILEALVEWMNDVYDDPEKQKKIEAMCNIELISSSNFSI